jgi:PKD repeat protein
LELRRRRFLDAAEPSHTYAAAGNYNVQLTASNAGGPNSTTKAGHVSPVSGGYDLRR